MILAFFCFAGTGISADTGEASGGGKKTPVTGLPGIFTLEALPRLGEKDRRWRYTLGGMYVRNTGNTESVNANGETALIYDDNIANFEITYRTFYARVNDETVENKGAGIVRIDYFVFSRMEIFIFSQTEYNREIRLTYRYNDGGGVKLVLFRNGFWKADFSCAPLYQMEKYRDEERKTGERWSLRARVNITPVKEMLMNYTYFYIPRMSDFRTFRSTHDASLKVSLGKNLSLKTGYIRQYNNDVMPGVKKKDDNLYGQISLEL